MALNYPGVEPPHYGRFAEMVVVARDVLEKSHVKSGVRVVIYTDTQRNKYQVDGFYAASLLLGAETCIVLNTPRKDPNRQPFAIPVAAMKEADTVIDLSSASWIYTPQFSEILRSGTRILSCMSNVDSCIKLPPDDDNATQARLAAQIIDKGKTIRVRSSVGTDLVLEKKGRAGDFQDGLLEDKPGDWDNFPSSGCACAPLEDGTNGKLVLDRGDILLHLKHFVSEPVVCEIEKGRIVSIDGGLDAELLRGWFKKWEDPNSYVIAHVGFGCDSRTELGAMQLMEWEAYGGGLLIAFGRNDGFFIGGTNVSKSHLDITMLNTDFEVDGQLLLQRGVIQRDVLTKAR